jgi:hypothetical protein
LLGDLFRARLLSVQELRYRAFDFETDHPSVRRLVLNELANLDHESYVSVSPGGGSYEPSDRWEWHCRVLNGMLSARLARTRGLIYLYVDESLDVGIDKASLAFSAPLLREKRDADAGWERVRIRTLRRTDCLRTLPTYIAQIICSAMEFGIGSNEMSAEEFRRLVSRVRVVSDTDKGIIYTGAMFCRELCR